MSNEQPFAGIRVIEFGQFIAVPFAAQLLAQGGADVIKIEALEGDPTRRLGQLVEGETRIYLSRNRGKRSLPLSLRHPRAAEVIDALLRDADVALTNFRPGLDKQLGLDADTLCDRYPRLIVGVVTPFGRAGPDAALAGMDIVVQARAGLMVANGRVDGERPMSGDPPSVDYMCATTLAYGVASALLRRERTGRGGAVHTSLMQAALTLNNNQMLRVESADGPIHAEALDRLAALREEGAGYAEQRAALPANRVRGMRQVYSCTYTTQDGWIAVACGSPKLRGAFAEAVGLDDPHLGQDSPELDDHYDALRERAERTIAAQSTADWERTFAAAGVPAADVKFPVELLGDAHADANAMFHDLDHPQLGPVRVLAPPLALDEDGFSPPPANAAFASETRAILSELGFDADEIETLIGDGVTRAV